VHLLLPHYIIFGKLCRSFPKVDLLCKTGGKNKTRVKINLVVCPRVYFLPHECSFGQLEQELQRLGCNHENTSIFKMLYKMLYLERIGTLKRSA